MEAGALLEVKRFCHARTVSSLCGVFPVRWSCPPASRASTHTARAPSPPPPPAVAHPARRGGGVEFFLVRRTASEEGPHVENRAVESDVEYSRARALELSALGTRAVTRAQSSRVQSLATRTSRRANALALGVDARVHRVVELTFRVLRGEALELSASGTRMGHACPASGTLPPRYANLAGGGYSHSRSRRAGSYIFDAPVTSYILDARDKPTT